MRDRSKAVMGNYKSYEWGGGASVWVNGVQVMKGGVLIGQAGRNWLARKIEAHKKWKRRKRRKEKV